MKKIKIQDKAYLAGVIDSDGCISIQKYSNCASYRVIITVIQKDIKIIEYLYSIFEGSVNVVSRKRKNTRDFYLRWVVTDKKAMELLKSIFSYLILKKQQAELAINLYSYKTRTYRSQRKGGYTEESKLKQKSFFIAIKNLNSTPATTESSGSLTKEMRQSELTEMVNRQSRIRSDFTA